MREWSNKLESRIMSLSTGTRLGPYEILASIGAGGMGKVIAHATPALTAL